MYCEPCDCASNAVVKRFVLCVFIDVRCAESLGFNYGLCLRKKMYHIISNQLRVHRKQLFVFAAKSYNVTEEVLSDETRGWKHLNSYNL